MREKMPGPTTLPPPEFSRSLSVLEIGEEEETHEIVASEAECAALCRRFGLVALDALMAVVAVRRLRGRTVIAVETAIAAKVVQTCVVTLEPVAAEVRDQACFLFEPMGEAAPDPAETPAAENPVEVVFEGDEDVPEPLYGDILDIGEVVAQHLSLAMDPYPRAPEAQFQAEYGPGEAALHSKKAPKKGPGKGHTAAGAPPEGEGGPFAALARWRKKPENPEN